MEKAEIRHSLDQLKPGSQISVKLEDGSTVAGKFKGTDGSKVQLDGTDDVALDKVDTVLMDVSSAGPE